MVGLGDFVLSFGIVVDIGLGDSDVVARKKFRGRGQKSQKLGDIIYGQPLGNL